MLKINHRFEYEKYFKETIKQAVRPMLAIIFIILFIKGIISEKFIKIFSISKENGVFPIISNLSNYKILGIDWLWIILFICLIGLSVSIILRLSEYYKEKLLIIQHTSFNAMNFKIDQSELKDYSIKELKLKQYESMENVQLELDDRINGAIREQIDFHKQARTFISKGYSLAYLGIAHTPLIFLLGFLLGDENSISLFHKRRDDIKDDKFHLLSSIGYSETLNKKCNYMGSFDTVLLCIETTFEIVDDDIMHIRNDNDCVLRYSTANKGFDVIYSAKQINEYIKFIKTDLNAICKLNNVKKVKICIASSVAFTFALARSFSANHDPEIEVFHYDAKSDLKYVWGINITERKVLIKGADY